MEKIKPISADINFQYSCPHCDNTFWLSFAETKTENYIAVCDVCQKPSSPTLIKNIKVIFDNSHKTQEESQDAEEETKMPKDIYDTCVNSLMQYGYTNKEAKSLVASVDDPYVWHDPVQIIKECLSKTNV